MDSERHRVPRCVKNGGICEAFVAPAEIRSVLRLPLQML
jgi:hypothetical protein